MIESVSTGIDVIVLNDDGVQIPQTIGAGKQTGQKKPCLFLIVHGIFPRLIKDGVIEKPLLFRHTH